jgi:hypothetical protein
MNDEPGARQNAANERWYAFLAKFEDGCEMVCLALRESNSRAWFELAQTASFNGQPHRCGKVTSLLSKEIEPGRIMPCPPDAHASRRLGQRCSDTALMAGSHTR